MFDRFNIFMSKCKPHRHEQYFGSPRVPDHTVCNNAEDGTIYNWQRLWYTESLSNQSEHQIKSVSQI